MENGLEVTKNYYASTRISNSLLKAIQSPRILQLKKEKPELFEGEDKTSFKIGSAVDCLLTAPREWEHRYRVSFVYKPYGPMGTFIQNLPPHLSADSDVVNFEKAYWLSGYKMSIKWVLDKFWGNKDNVDYYNTVNNCPEGITVLAKDEYDSVVKAVELVTASPYAQNYFVKSKTWEERLHQVPIYFQYKNQDFKALLDGILINHKDKTIDPFDLKTTGKSVYLFKESYLMYGYYTQAALYNYAIQQPESPVYNLIQEGYKILDFKFIVAETKVSAHNPAIIFETTTNDIEVGLKGGFHKDTYYKGIDQLLEDYLWHIEHNEWVYPRSVYENNGKVTLNVFENART
jgi:hypothetical protein